MDELSAIPDEAADVALSKTFIDWRTQRRNADRVRDIPVNELYPDERSVRKDNRIVYGRVPMVSWQRNQLVCKDGFRMSVQDSPMLYSFYDDDLVCTHVEVGFPSEVEPLLMPWADDESAPTDTVYGYVPIPVVLAVIEKHGGRARWYNPDPVDWWQRFCAIQRNSFIPIDGRVRRVDDRCGRWIEQYEASKIVDGMLEEIRELRAARDGCA